MNLFKKIVACGLAFSVAFSGICAIATNPTTGGQKSSNISSSVKNKIIGGVAALGGIGLLAGGIGAWRYNRLNILVMGSDEDKRNELIELLNRPAKGWGYLATEEKLGSGQKRPSKWNEESVLDYYLKYTTQLDPDIDDITRENKKYEAQYKYAAKLKNYKISSCGLDNQNTSKLIKNAQLIIVIPGGNDNINETNASINTIKELLSQHRNKDSLVWEVWDEDCRVKARKDLNAPQSLKDWIDKKVTDFHKSQPTWDDGYIIDEIKIRCKQFENAGYQTPISGNKYSFNIAPDAPRAFWWSKTHGILRTFL